jgi:hypothetical protein
MKTTHPAILPVALFLAGALVIALGLGAARSTQPVQRTPAPEAASTTAPANEAPTATAVATAVQAAPAPAFLETFDGNPSAPQPWKASNWDVTVHSRDVGTWEELEPVAAMHGSDCSAPPSTHMVSSYNDAVFLCRDHLMTAIKAEGYGVIYLTPNQMVDFSSGEAVVRFDLSTLRSSQRDWVDLWITPYSDQLQLPLEDWLPDLSGVPRNAIHVRMNSFNDGTNFNVFVIKDFVATELPGQSWVGYESMLTPDAKRRDTFELRISRAHIQFGMPAYHFSWVSADMPELGWERGVVQFGHHSYNPSKSDGCGSVCEPNTWHWDNISISPAQPFSILRADRRSVGPDTTGSVNFPAPAPQEAHLRFAGIGVALELSFDGGANWQAAQLQAQKGLNEDHFKSYWMPVPAGTSSVQFRGRDWRGGPWQVRDISIWAK